MLTLDVDKHPIYLISDIHANLSALRAVLDAIPSDAIVLCAGDILGYYIEPNEVCEVLQQRSVFCIQGNHDKYVLGTLAYPSEREHLYRILPTRRNLSAENMAWIASLPDFLELRVARPTLEAEATCSFINIFVSHGTPRNVEEYIYPDTPIDFLAHGRTGYLILGHTHHPMIRRAAGLAIINPGSIGQARDRIPGACYASLDLTSGNAEFHRVNYSIADYQESLLNVGVHRSMVDMLSRS